MEFGFTRRGENVGEKLKVRGRGLRGIVGLNFGSGSGEGR